MCGIVGILSTENAPQVSDIETMLESISYRGPDGRGHVALEADGVTLGHCRLSILDLSEASNQPMVDTAGRFWLVYNGEIYNYIEIRRELESLGYTFRSGGDTEVLLRAYEHWGSQCLDHFIGMYAFAIWDRNRRELFAARDRLGIKPFYYQEVPNGLLFASEIKAIIAVSHWRPAVDLSLIDAFMDFGYVPGQSTLHKGIKRLLPGHCLYWRNNQVSVKQYWDCSFDEQVEEGIGICADRIAKLLTESVSIHLRSDVPLGVFLSGGLDSSAVVSLSAQGANRGLKTFSVAYDFGKEFDETPYAREVAHTFSTNHHEIRITPKQFLSSIPDFIWHMDEPVTEAAGVSLFYLSKLAREHVAVCLSGEGSDELFAGYDFYTYNMAMECARRYLGAAPFRLLAALARKVSSFAKMQKYLELSARPLEDRYRGISSYEPNKKLSVYSSDFARFSAESIDGIGIFIEGLFSRTRLWDPLSRMLYFDTKTWLVDDLLIKADRMSMSASVELRVPFLDHRLVEAAARIPSAYKISGTNTKRILKRILKKNLPSTIIKRRKMGFPTPLELMFRGELYDYAHQTLMSQEASDRGYFDREAVKRLLLDHKTGKAANHREIWQLVVLEEWHRRFGY